MSLKDLLKKSSTKVALSVLVTKLEDKISQNPDIIGEYIERNESLAKMIPEKYLPTIRNFFYRRPELVSIFDPDSLVDVLFDIAREINSWAVAYAVGYLKAHPKAKEWLAKNYNDMLMLAFGLELEEVKHGRSKHRSVSKKSRKTKKRKNR